jgi:hypothetical protein
MAAGIEPKTELAMSLRLSKRAGEKLVQRAAQSGQDVATVASDLIERAINQPTVDEVLAPFRKQVAESGMSDAELDAFFEDAREKAFEERQRRAE